MKMTREEEVARLAEIEAMPHMSDKFKANMRKHFERGWWMEEHGVIDMMRWKVERIVERVEKT